MSLQSLDSGLHRNDENSKLVIGLQFHAVYSVTLYVVIPAYAGMTTSQSRDQKVAALEIQHRNLPVAALKGIFGVTPDPSD